MAELVIAMTYGNALFSAAKELNIIHEVKDEILQIDQIFSNEKEYFGLLNNPAISNIKKKNLVRSVFEGRIEEHVLSFLLILVDKERIFHFSKIVTEYNKLVDEYEGYGEGIVYSVVPLTEKQIEDFEREAGKLLQERIKLKNEIDKTLIGGVKLMVDGKLIDASLRGRLDNLTLKLEQL